MSPSVAAFLLFFLCSSSAQPSPFLSVGDLQALLDVRKSLFDLPGSTFFSSWTFSSNPCGAFAGVTCSADDRDGNLLRVTVLTLGTGLTDSPGLGGTLSPSICNLTALTELVIFPGRITGPIPAELGPRLPFLRLLSISSNRLLGTIPASLSGLLFLHTLDLSQNQLHGPLPPSLLSSSPSLKVLLVAYNGGLSGTIPSELTSATNLLHLDLRGNSFTGPLPTLPSSLRFLSASLNSLSGNLPLPSPFLEFLDLSANAFTGELPPSLFAAPRLCTILLSRNNLSGDISIPFSSETEPSWAVVDVSHNLLSGKLPAELAAASNLYVNNNRFTGAVPEEYIGSVINGSMTILYAQDNYLTEFAAAGVPALASLCLSYNCMVPPVAAIAGCPSGSQDQLSRPPSQCVPAATATDRP